MSSPPRQGPGLGGCSSAQSPPPLDSLCCVFCRNHKVTSEPTAVFPPPTASGCDSDLACGSNVLHFLGLRLLRGQRVTQT